MANLRSERRGRREGGDGRGARTPLRVGTIVAESSSGLEARIVDYACQYAHPQAAPVFQYLIRWDDGQVEAISESALRNGGGLEVLEEDGAGD
jgi:hypothetical protein